MSVTRSERPVPRLSNRIRRENEASRVRKRASVGSSQNTSMFETQPIADANRLSVAWASAAISRTISDAGWIRWTRPTPCPAHSERASMSPSVPRLGV